MNSIIVLGHKGMLGNMAVKYFKQKGYNVHTIDQRYEFAKREGFITTINGIEDSVILNCIGKIKQKTADPQALYNINALLPLDLTSMVKEGHFLIQPGTDCVFDGTADTPYGVDEKCTANDDYGVSKYLGEKAVVGKKNGMVVRVSIIGPEISGECKNGLLGWFLSLKDEECVKGFSNHYWNGITTLEWCSTVETIIENIERYRGQVVQLGTKEIYSKYEMLHLFNEVYSKNLVIDKFATRESCFRVLEPEIVSKNLKRQLEDLVSWTSVD